MTEKRFNGKAIYQPKGKAEEYSQCACNFYTGCSNNCSYCYCKMGVLSHVWDTEPHLKKYFKDEQHAIDVFTNELIKNREELQRNGLFFSFTTDPLLPATIGLTKEAIKIALKFGVPCQVLTKRADGARELLIETDKWGFTESYIRQHLALGFTLTGCDEDEPNASGNFARIIAMCNFHAGGYKTFASVEPIIKVHRSIEMIRLIAGVCDLVKVGLMSQRKDYKTQDLKRMIDVMAISRGSTKYYLKDSFVEFLNLDRSDLPSRFVNSGYNIFTHK